MSVDSFQIFISFLTRYTLLFSCFVLLFSPTSAPASASAFGPGPERGGHQQAQALPQRPAQRERAAPWLRAAPWRQARLHGWPPAAGACHSEDAQKDPVQPGGGRRRREEGQGRCRLCPEAGLLTRRCVCDPCTGAVTGRSTMSAPSYSIWQKWGVVLSVRQTGSLVKGN